jgi:hypothetical protein
LYRELVLRRVGRRTEQEVNDGVGTPRLSASIAFVRLCF